MLGPYNKKRRKIQKGLWEHLLCEDCEQYLNQNFDHPFHHFWSAPDRFPKSLRQEYVTVNGIDYCNAKRFLLSVLWRAHVSKNQIISAVDLGPHVDRIRNILLSKDITVSQNNYPVFGYALRDPKTDKPAKQFVLTPVRKRTKGRWNYKVAFLGCAWQIFVSSSRPPLPESCMLKKDGKIVMPIINFNEFPPMRRVFEMHTS